MKFFINYVNVPVNAIYTSNDFFLNTLYPVSCTHLTLSHSLSSFSPSVGIVVSDWTYTKKLHSDQTQTGLRNITFMTWDFGGQVLYY